MVAIQEPMFRDMSKAEAEALLRRNCIGRVAYSFKDSVDIRPIHYVWRKGWLFGRTSEGDKLVTLRHNHWVAFQVDEISGPLDWQSVIVRGSFYRLSPEGSIYDTKLYGRAIRAIREAAPAAFMKTDPVPFRSEIFGISLDKVTGRSSSITASG